LKIYTLSLLVMAGLSVPQTSAGQITPNSTEQKRPCFVQPEEIEVIQSYLRESIASPQVLVTQTENSEADVDVDTLNLRLAVQGRGIPPEVRTSFKEKNRTICQIKSFGGIPNLHFISRRDQNAMFRELSTGWKDFHRVYGKEAELISVTRVGFNPEKTLALIHVSSAIDKMAGGGMLYLFERKNGKWVVKSRIQTWVT
jgi:hypothetical protein